MHATYHIFVAFVDVDFRFDQHLNDLRTTQGGRGQNETLTLHNATKIRCNMLGDSKEDRARKSNINCLLVALGDVGFELDESFHGFGYPAIQTSNENGSFALQITININALI